MLDKIIFHYPIFDRRLDFDTEELTQLELVGRVAESLNGVIDIINTWQGQLNEHELSTDITNNRKLSPLGNFTGLLMGKPVLNVIAQTNNSTDMIKYLASQFADGQTGMVIDGGFFEDSGIGRNYNGGVF